MGNHSKIVACSGFEFVFVRQIPEWEVRVKWIP